MCRTGIRSETRRGLEIRRARHGPPCSRLRRDDRDVRTRSAGGALDQVHEYAVESLWMQEADPRAA